ncbi:MAG: RecQ family ATP-dependent DNA helicase [Bacteroidales bacterium]|nr:RecQ family ATP-dependent DNA helicase [Candidatus Colicola faecequi]
MSLIGDFMESIRTEEIVPAEAIQTERNSSCYAFVDVEVGIKDHKIHDIGAVRWDGGMFHKNSKLELMAQLRDIDYICGHNIIHHDARYLLGDEKDNWAMVDTLYMSPLLFPERPYHKLVKDDKLMSDQMNNPVNDCEKARDLLMDEISRWQMLSEEKQVIFASLLYDKLEFAGFMEMVGAKVVKTGLAPRIKEAYRGKICQNADLKTLVRLYPIELAFALALVDTTDYRSITPSWVLHNYPSVENVVKLLRHTRCAQGCEYCNTELDLHHNLKRFFGYDEFRTYEGEPLQENAARAAVDGKSLLAIFPTGGGKSLTFQLPALIEGRTVHGLTVVISPLQSLMKDQVDNLGNRGILDAVTINGMLDPLSRAEAIERVSSGEASLLYIAPEMLRSSTIEKILLARHVVRFVIDEAHCFSSWGHDFRVDYLYIGNFIKRYEEKKGCKEAIPVSCFTATAKQKVIQDICDYFKKTLDLNLELYASKATRTNLRYSVIHSETDEDKYVKLRSLVAESNCPTIVYVSRTKRTKELAQRLTRDGYRATYFNGKLDPDEKIVNQEAFMTDQVQIIVATSAFGMGVDKSDVGLVIHYDISDSLENYVQEAGRAGRDPHLQAKCYVLYSDSDLDKHFILLNQTKLSLSEIQQVWRAIKMLTTQRERVCCSALEIARAAGWDDSVPDLETRVKTALSALEQSAYIERANNVPHVYATGITVKNVDEARERITNSVLFEKEEIEKAVRVIKSLISQKSKAKAQDPEAEARIDYLADILGLSKTEVISVVSRMRQEGILADSRDISAFLLDENNADKKSTKMLERFAKLERYLHSQLSTDKLQSTYKQLNDNAQKEDISTSTEKDIRTLVHFLAVKDYVFRKEDVGTHTVELKLQTSREATLERFEKRIDICRFTIDWLYQLAARTKIEGGNNKAVQFSILELLKDYKNSMFAAGREVTISDIEESLLYMSKIGALKLEGGFLVLYNAMAIRRKEDRSKQYKKADYRMLDEFYKMKTQQVHIVGEYANLMVKDYNAALRFVQDYFHMDYKKFIAQYFKGERQADLDKNITPQKYKKLFEQLSPKQREIIENKESRCIVVAAGPGSGKTRVLVHKLASLLLMEDVKHEQLLMLTFSRAAATEFKQRLMDLIGNAAHFVEIKTFHAYCFDLLGRIGNLEDAKAVVAKAAAMINDGEVEPSKIAKTVLVIDEAQDMSEDEYALVHALMSRNEEMRVIAVGDDDQNIYQFRGSDSKYLAKLKDEEGSCFVEMVDNYRSSRHVVAYANEYVKKIVRRMKTTPIHSMSKEDGWVGITYHNSESMYQPLVEELLMQRNGGSMSVLTQTNEEALTLVALLRKHGLNSKLIQSLDGFAFWNIMEVRYFLKYLSKEVKSPVIPDVIWEKAKRATYQMYDGSTSLPYLKRCVECFESMNKLKYYSDFREFILESSVEDFCDISNADVVVSTIHKAKGREFDDVYMLIDGQKCVTDDNLRRRYVGITRAKKRLFVHTSDASFHINGYDSYQIDNQQYSMPDEVVLQLSHKDVILDYFKGKKAAILERRAGDELRYYDNMLYDAKGSVGLAKLSAKMQGELVAWQEKGYEVKSSNIRFIVAWKPKDSAKNDPEYAVLLADLKLQKK